MHNSFDFDGISSVSRLASFSFVDPICVTKRDKERETALVRGGEWRARFVSYFGAGGEINSLDWPIRPGELRPLNAI